MYFGETESSGHIDISKVRYDRISQTTVPAALVIPQKG